MNKKNPSHYATKSAIEWYLHAGHFYGTLSESQARQLAAVNRTTFDRWQRGQSSAPAATLELLRLHAFGEPPGGFGKAWAGFRFQRDILVTPYGEVTPGDLRTFHFYRRIAHQYMNPTERAQIPSAAEV